MSHTPGENPRHDETGASSGDMSTSSRTPVRRGEVASTPALPGPVESAVQPPDVDPPRDIGWLIMMIGAVGVLLATWTLFGIEADAMWAGYWTTGLASTAILGALWLYNTLPKAPGLVLAGLSGAGLILVAIVQNYPPIITIPMIAGGAFIIAGAGLAAGGGRR